MVRDKKYGGRVYRDKALKERIEADLEKIVYSFMTGDRTLKITEGEFDPYPYCKDRMRGICPLGKTKKYQGYISPGGWGFHGNSKIELYCEIIGAMVGQEMVFPLI